MQPQPSIRQAEREKCSRGFPVIGPHTHAFYIEELGLWKASSPEFLLSLVAMLLGTHANILAKQE